jgi:hypothetical protein
MNEFINRLSGQLGQYLPSLVGAIAILILGWLVATIVASVTRGILKRTNIDNRLAQWVLGEEASEVPIERWISTAVYWIIMVFVLVAFLNALQLQVVSEPLGNFLDQIFNYLPKVGGAAIVLVVAWALATVSKLLLTRGLARFNLDDRLAQQMGTPEGESPFLVNETLANVLYWFILLFFLPLILDLLDLQGPLQPVQNLLDDILSALPRILTATIIALAGWLVARILRGIVTNLLSATGLDRLGEQFGVSADSGTVSLSSLVGTIVYILVLIPTAIAALDALEIQAVSDPAVSMLEQILQRIPQFFTAAIILVVFYVIGKFVAELVTNLLTSLGFNNIFTWLGLPSLQTTTPERTEPTDQSGTPPAPNYRTPSEILGIVAWVAIILFGAVAAAEVLRFAEITAIVRATLRISAQVLSGVVVFAIGLYLANLAFNLINSSGNRQARILAQTARIAIIALVGAMGLQQMGVATDIVNLAFGLLLGSIAVAIALAFGLGGRDIAAEQIRAWLENFKREQ